MYIFPWQRPCRVGPPVYWGHALAHKVVLSFVASTTGITVPGSGMEQEFPGLLNYAIQASICMFDCFKGHSDGINLDP